MINMPVRHLCPVANGMTMQRNSSSRRKTETSELNSHAYQVASRGSSPPKHMSMEDETAMNSYMQRHDCKSLIVGNDKGAVAWLCPSNLVTVQHSKDISSWGNKICRMGYTTERTW